jgi:ACS family glucarate transporter-like MFS transporter
MNMGCQIGGAVTASLTPYIASRMGWIAAFVFAAVLAVLGGAMWLLVDPARSKGPEAGNEFADARSTGTQVRLK